MDSAFIHQGSNAQSQSSHSHSQSHRPIQFPSELKQGSGFHHIQHHNRNSQDDLSSLAMSAVDVVEFHTSELHVFSDVAAPYRGFGAPAEPLLVNQTLLLPEQRSSVPTHMLRQNRNTVRRQLPRKRQAESQESVRIQQGSSSSSSFPGASVGHFGTPDTRAIPGGWDDESGRLSTRLSGDAVGGGAPVATGQGARRDQVDQDGQKERQGSGHLPMKMVENPPDLARWRQRLFDLEKMVVLSQEE